MLFEIISAAQMWLAYRFVWAELSETVSWIGYLILWVVVFFYILIAQRVDEFSSKEGIHADVSSFFL